MILNNIIVVDQPPVAAFYLTQQQDVKPLAVQFNNTSTGAATYLWEFGDGTIQHLYHHRRFIQQQVLIM